jgi:hypothetical protein
LADAYIADKEAAKKQYGGKDYIVEGVLASGSFADPVFIILTSGVQDEPGAKCMFTLQDLSELGKLDPGQSVKVEGIIGDYKVDVVVNNCRIVK